MQQFYVEEGQGVSYSKRGLAGLSTRSIGIIVGVVATVVVLGVVLGLIPVYISAANSSGTSYSQTTVNGLNTVTTTSSGRSIGKQKYVTAIVTFDKNGRSISTTDTSVTISSMSTSTLDAQVITFFSTSTYINRGIISITISWTSTTSSSSSSTLWSQEAVLTFTQSLSSSNTAGPSSTDEVTIGNEYINNCKISSTTFGTVSSVQASVITSLTFYRVYGYFDNSNRFYGNSCTGYDNNSATRTCQTYSGNVQGQPNGSFAPAGVSTPPPLTIASSASSSGGGRFGPGAYAPNLIETDYIVYEMN